MFYREKFFNKIPKVQIKDGGEDNFHYITWKTLIVHAKKLQENLLTTDWDKFSKHETIKKINISEEKGDLEVKQDRFQTNGDSQRHQ